MRTRLRTSAATAAVLLLLGLTLFGPAGSTTAAWYRNWASKPVPATTDIYSLTVEGLSDDGVHEDPAAGDVWNHPGFDIRNDSTTLTRTISLSRTKLRSRYSYADTRLDLLHQATVAFRLAPAGGRCGATGSRELWKVRSGGQAMAPMGIYNAPRTASVTLQPGETRRVCLVVQPVPGGATTAERRTILERFAGAGIRADTDIVAQHQLSTDGVDTGVATSFLRVALPRPTADSTVTDTGGRVLGCEIAESTTFHGYARLAWTWAGTTGRLTTGPTAIRSWQLWYRSADQPWQQVTDGNYLRAGDWTNAPRYDGGTIPAGKRELFIERGFIRKAGLDNHHLSHQYAIVAVLNTSTSTRAVATHSWQVSWNGRVTAGWNAHACVRTLTPPADLGGALPTPGSSW